MKCIVKKIALFFLLFLSSFIFAQNAVFVSQDSILNSISDYKINVARIDTLSSKYQKEITSAKAKVKAEFDKLISFYLPLEGETLDIVKKRMSATDVSKIELYYDEVELLDKKAKTYDAIVKADYDTNVAPILQKVNKTLEVYAKKNKIDVIYILERISPALAYVNKQKYVTKEIIAMLK